MAYKLTRVYIEWHLALLCSITSFPCILEHKLSSHVSQCAMLDVIMYVAFHFKKLPMLKKEYHIGNKQM